MKKLCLTIMAISPHQVKFCYTMQKYYNTESWFYEGIGSRQSWWSVPLGDKCKFIDGVFFKWRSKYLTFSILRMLKEFNPDILWLGGFSIPANYIAYVWAKLHKRKTVMFSESSRKIATGELRGYSLAWRIIHFLYKDLDLIMVSSEDVVPQFRDTFRFGDKVVVAKYPADLDAYFEHPLRQEKAAYTYLFPNRLTPIYDPLKAISVFYKIHRKYPGSRLVMNASGELLTACKADVVARNIENAVEFLTEIQSWDKLHEVYRDSDIMLLPASFSNGNFTIYEAMASGMGIVVSNRILGVSSLINDGQNGFCCTPSEDEFVKRIMEYINKPWFLEQHGCVNKEKARPLSLEGAGGLITQIFHDHGIG